MQETHHRGTVESALETLEQCARFLAVSRGMYQYLRRDRYSRYIHIADTFLLSVKDE